jgi:transglutaminase-like putative cysteine protease
MHFDYDDFIRESQMEIRVEPQMGSNQAVHSFQLAVGPAASVDRYVDWNDNWVHNLAVRDYHNRIEIVARSLVDTISSHRGLQDAVSPPTSDVPGEFLDFCQFGGPVTSSPELEAVGKDVAVALGAPVGEQVAAIGDMVAARIDYQPGVTNWRSTVSDVLQEGSGVCQDFAHLCLALLRLRGIPCRYISGYLHVGEQPAQSHAWVEFYAGTEGWLAFDPTHSRVPDENYVVVGAGRSYEDVPPNRGVYRGRARETLEVVVSTRPAAGVNVVGLRDQIEGLDVPVYAELPSRGRDSRFESDEVHDRVARQQQQQQQQ